MTTRMILGYGLVAVMVLAGLVGLWFAIFRDRLAHRRRRARGERERVARRDADARPAYEAE